MNALFDPLHEPVSEKGTDTFPDSSIIPAGGLETPPEPADEEASYSIERLAGIR